MKTIILFLSVLLITHAANAQWNLGFQTGLNKTLYKAGAEPGGTQLWRPRSSPALLTSAYIITNKDWPVNIGGGLGIKQNRIDLKYEQVFGSGQKTIRDIEHRSAYLAISPIVDVGIGKKKFIHLLIAPSMNLLLWGRENGYTQYQNGEYYSYHNTSKNISRVSLGMNALLQARYPLTNMLELTGGIGYSINNSVSRTLWNESGNASFQFGVIYKLPALAGNKKDDKQAETN